MVKRHQRPTAEAAAGRHHRARGVAAPLERDADLRPLRQADPHRHRGAGRRPQGRAPAGAAASRGQGLATMAKPGGKSRTQGTGGWQGRRPGPRAAARGATRAPPEAPRRQDAAQGDRRGPAAPEGALRPTVIPAAHEGARVRERSGRCRGSRRSCSTWASARGARTRRSSTPPPPSCSRSPGQKPVVTQGQEVDRELQAARGHADRRHGDAAGGAHVRVPRSAGDVALPARARLQGRARPRASTAAATTRSASASRSSSRRSTSTRSTRSGMDVNIVHDGADRRGGARRCCALGMPFRESRDAWPRRALIIKALAPAEVQGARATTAASCAGGRAATSASSAVPPLLPRPRPQGPDPGRREGELVTPHDDRSDRRPADPHPQRQPRRAREGRHPVVASSRCAIAELLKDEGFIKNFRVLEDGKQGMLRVYLKYGTGATRG